jgi:hypothetical protein
MKEQRSAQEDEIRKIWIRQNNGGIVVYREISLDAPVKPIPKLRLNVSFCDFVQKNVPVELFLEIFSWLTPSEIYSFRFLLLSRSIYHLLFHSEETENKRQNYWFQLIENARNIDPVCVYFYPVLRLYYQNRNVRLLAQRKREDNNWCDISENINQMFINAK